MGKLTYQFTHILGTVHLWYEWKGSWFVALWWRKGFCRITLAGWTLISEGSTISQVTEQSRVGKMVLVANLIWIDKTLKENRTGLMTEMQIRLVSSVSHIPFSKAYVQRNMPFIALSLSSLKFYYTRPYHFQIFQICKTETIHWTKRKTEINRECVDKVFLSSLSFLTTLRKNYYISILDLCGLNCS